MSETEPIAIEARLADGSRPAEPEDLFARLEELGIEFETDHHRAVFTVDESRDLRARQHGGHTKNLLLRNKKKQFWLLLARADTRVDLKAVAEQVGSGRFSFGKAEELMALLGVRPGAVTPFAVINDRGGIVDVLIDRALLPEFGGEDPLLVHPLRNTMTTDIDQASGKTVSVVDGVPDRWPWSGRRLAAPLRRVCSSRRGCGPRDRCRSVCPCCRVRGPSHRARRTRLGAAL